MLDLPSHMSSNNTNGSASLVSSQPALFNAESAATSAPHQHQEHLVTSPPEADRRRLNSSVSGVSAGVQELQRTQQHEEKLKGNRLSASSEGSTKAGDESFDFAKTLGEVIRM